MSAIFVWWRPFSARTRVAAASRSWRVRSRRRSKRFGPATAVFEDAFMTEYQFSYLGSPMMSRGAAVVGFSPRRLTGRLPRERRQAPDHDRSRFARGGFHHEALSRLDREGEAGLVVPESPPSQCAPHRGQTASTPTRSSISADRRHAAAIATARAPSSRA